MRSSLLLNADYAPMSIIPATRAVTMILAGDAVSLDDSSVLFRSPSVSVPVPYVLLAKKYTKRSKNSRDAKFSRRGVMIRDNHTCVYCGKHADTIDHVIPRKDGGTSTYENCVAACTPCNRKKGHKSLKQMNWSLPATPKVPSLYATMLGKVANSDEHFNAWSPYILMFEPELEKAFAQNVSITE
jgi:5-methylcytosine-specific restriction endonuclease McrA